MVCEGVGWHGMGRGQTQPMLSACLSPPLLTTSASFASSNPARTRAESARGFLPPAVRTQGRRQLLVEDRKWTCQSQGHGQLAAVCRKCLSPSATGTLFPNALGKKRMCHFQDRWSRNCVCVDDVSPTQFCCLVLIKPLACKFMLKSANSLRRSM